MASGSGLRRFVAAASILLGASAAQAGILNGHADALAGATGSVPFNNGVGLSGTIDFSVFTAAAFNSNFAGLGYVPGAPFVYTYQVIVGGTLGVSAEIIGITNAANTIGTFDIGGVDASSAAFTPNARWLFSPEIPGGSSSYGLAFSSPQLPIVGGSLTVDGGTTAFAAGVPTPGPSVPEPGSLLLLASGALAACLSRRGRRGMALCAALALGAAGASAGSLATTNRALNDGFGPDAGRWHGSVVVAGAALGDTVVAEVDWAAFAPGAFQLYLNDQAIAQVDPSGPGEVVYVYQIISVSSASPGIDTLTVGLDAADGRGTVSAPSFVPTGAGTEQSPTGGGDNTTSMAWFFSGVELQVGDISSLLLFSSPFSPEFDFLQVNSGLAGPPVSPLVASPSDRRFVPEPAGMLLGLVASFALLRRARKR
jgi:hypothetical protein